MRCCRYAPMRASRYCRGALSPVGASRANGNTETERTRTDVYGEKLFPSTGETDRKVVEAVAAVASARGVPRAQVALSWLIRRPGVTAPIIGAAKTQHLDDAAAALEIELTADETARLEVPYVPHAVTGHE